MAPTHVFLYLVPSVFLPLGPILTVAVYVFGSFECLCLGLLCMSLFVSQGASEVFLGTLTWLALVAHSIVHSAVTAYALCFFLDPLSWFSLCSCSLCFRIPLMVQAVCRRVWVQRGTCSFQGPMDGIELSEQPICKKLTC